MKKRNKIWEASINIAAVAQGIKAADMIIKNACLVNVNTAVIEKNIDIAIIDGRIASIGNLSDYLIDDNTVMIDADGLYAAPGFMDGHMHVESSMLTVREYARTVIPHGTTAIFMDPHEIANVMGMPGIKLMMEDGKDIPMQVWTTMPSCVPAVEGFEDSGSAINVSDISQAMKLEGIIGLGEMMNFPGILSGDTVAHSKVAAALKEGKPATGHYSIPETGSGLSAYAGSGICCCHEAVRKEDAYARMRLGMYAMMREGSAWQDLAQTIRSITENDIDSRFAILVSDDAHPGTLLNKGHMDYILRRAVSEGLDPVKAIQMVTINVAQCFGIAQDFGSISPGKYADIVLLSDLKSMDIEKVIYNGGLVAEGGRLKVDIPKYKWPKTAKSTVKLKRSLELSDLVVKVPADVKIEDGKVRIRTIGALENQAGTKEIIKLMSVKDRYLHADIELDTAKIAVVERHHATGNMSVGFVSGFGLKRGAVASTVSHDAHNLIIIGTNDSDMVIAAAILERNGGGLCVVDDGKCIASLPLPIAGLISGEDAQTTDGKLDELSAAWKHIGCKLASPFMTMSLLSLACIPEIRITDLGLVDTVYFEFTDIYIK